MVMLAMNITYMYMGILHDHRGLLGVSSLFQAGSIFDGSNGSGWKGHQAIYSSPLLETLV